MVPRNRLFSSFLRLPSATAYHLGGTLSNVLSFMRRVSDPYISAQTGTIVWGHCSRRHETVVIVCLFFSFSATGPAKGAEDALAALMTEAGMEEQAARLRKLKV